ncbi:MAG: hypothetical protein IAE77_02835 [Prosthecobacter sp.]|jgi:hypothetical protein|uniref:hypothetical protein n=1 Tax=Prosthecobacter sp. TaxID=1965333 RepID=UPI001A02CB38|nr:hypothetical protein [Prosthecobacter sp.]MBE2282379.1 hypothetical protein [Prosthecobacter sp.]
MIRLQPSTIIFLVLGIARIVLSHPADQSEMRMRPAPHQLEGRFTFNILTLTRFVGMDVDGDGKLSMAELDGAQPVIAEYLNSHIRLDINQQKASWGTKVKFDYLWPNAGVTPSMTEIEYAARNVDVTFTVPVAGRLLEDFWIAFEIFEQTGPLQTIRGMYEQEGKVLEVSFNFQEPEYTYDTGFAEDPFEQEAEKKAVMAPEPVKWPAWLLIPAVVALIVLFRSITARRRRTSR